MVRHAVKMIQRPILNLRKEHDKVQKVKVGNFLCGTNGKMLHHLKEIIKKKPLDVTDKVATNDLANNINLLNNGTKIRKVISKVNHCSLKKSDLTESYWLH